MADECDPPNACATHGRCWTHSEWDDMPGPTGRLPTPPRMQNLSPRTSTLKSWAKPGGLRDIFDHKTAHGPNATEMNLQAHFQRMLERAHRKGVAFDAGTMGAAAFIEYARAYVPPADAASNAPVPAPPVQGVTAEAAKYLVKALRSTLWFEPEPPFIKAHFTLAAGFEPCEYCGKETRARYTPPLREHIYIHDEVVVTVDQKGALLSMEFAPRPAHVLCARSRFDSPRDLREACAAAGPIVVEEWVGDEETGQEVERVVPLGVPRSAYRRRRRELEFARSAPTRRERREPVGTST